MVFEKGKSIPLLSLPDFQEETEYLLTYLCQLSEEQLEKLMKMSPQLATLNYQRFQSFSQADTQAAILAYQGDVFKQLNLSEYQEQDYLFAQDHVRLISGLYGLLKPLDRVKPYRLEMSTRLATEKAKNLLIFWTDKVTQQLSQELESHTQKILVNLASDEYSSVINIKNFTYPILNISFKEMREGKLKTIGLIAKKNRGAMTNWIIKNKIDDPLQLKEYHELSYFFSSELSTEWEFVFIKD